MVKDCYGMPYMGGKRRLAAKILKRIREINPAAVYFYDLFGGGGAISFEAVKRGFQVIYNEKKKCIYELMKKLKFDGVTDEMFTFIDKETFDILKYNDDYIGGLCIVGWSFNNTGRSYLYGKGIINKKFELHNYLMKNDYLKYKNEIYRRMIIKEYLQYLERLQHIERLEYLYSMANAYYKGIKIFDNIELYNKDYKDVIINTPIEQTVIYCDIPYRNTEGYNIEFNYDEFYNWCDNNKYPIFISEYNTKYAEIACWDYFTGFKQYKKEKLYLTKNNEKSIFI